MSTGEFVDLIEMGCEYCSLQFSVLPCTASGPPGSECFNTFKTCQDRDNFDPITRWHRIIAATRARLPSLPVSPASLADPFGDGSQTHAVPMITRPIEVTPIRISPGESLGNRGQISVMMSDRPWHDMDLDPYVSTRDYVPSERGTYFGKFRARHFYENKIVKHYVVPVLDDQRLSLAGVVPTQYIASVLTGPDRDGMVKLVCKDPLKLLDDDRAKLGPPVDVTLLFAISDVDVSAKIDGDEIESIPESSSFIRIDDEIILATRSGTVISLARGQRGTIASSHDADASVYPCIRLTGGLDDVIASILDGVGVPSSYIPSAEWQAEIDEWRVVSLDTLLTEPVGAQTLVNELAEQFMLQIWPDLEAAKFRLRALRPQAPTVTWTEGGEILRDSFKRKDLRDSRISDVIVFFGQRDVTEDLDEDRNYQSVIGVRDESASSDREYGSRITKVIRSRWLKTADRAFAITMAFNLLAEYRDTPAEYTIELDASDTVGLAGVAQLSYQSVQDASGAVKTTDVQVIEEARLQPGGRHRVVLREFLLGGRFTRYMDDGSPDYADATDAERADGGWYAADDLKVDGDEPYKYYPG